MAGDQLFGTILSLSNDSGTIVFVAVMIFLTFFEAGQFLSHTINTFLTCFLALHHLEKVGGKLGYKALIMKLYREFMILGFISFTLQILSTVTHLPEDDKWYAAFHFAHIVILFVGIAFLIQSFLLITLISQRNKRLLYYDSCTSESLFFEYIQLHDSKNDIFKYLFNYGPISIPIPELREKIEFKIIQEYFIRSYKLDAKFKFANYMCKVLKNYIMSLMDVRPVNWFRVAFLVALNYLRILIFDPLYESDICENNPYEEHVENRSKNYGHHVCPEYQLRIVFVGIAAMTVYQGIVFILSEVYMQRLIGKVLDDEETLQWLDTEEAHAIEENHRTTASAFPHVTELLNPNETPFRKNSITNPANEEKTAAPEFPIDLPPIVPVLGGKAPRFGSASEAINIEQNTTKQFRRSSIRRSLSYKSPLNDKNSLEVVESLAPVQEAPIAAPPNRNLRERRNSITIHVPVHRDSVQAEASRGSLVSMEENTKALTTDVNTYNRRHLYLKCLERIIHVEYSYHETEARRTSVSSESEAYGLAEHHPTHRAHAPTTAPALTRHNSGRGRANTLHAPPSMAAGSRFSTGSGANATDSPPVGEGDSLERINQLKALNMKNLRELMIKSKTMNPEAFADGAGSPNPNHVYPVSPGHHSRQNSSGSGASSKAGALLRKFASTRGSASSNATNGGQSPSPPHPQPAKLGTSLVGLFDPISPSPNNSNDGGEKAGFNFLNVLPSSKKHSKLPSVDSNPGVELTRLTPPTTTDGASNKVSVGESIPAPTNRVIKRDFTTKFFEFQSEDDSKEHENRNSRLNAYSDDPNATNIQRAWAFFLDCSFYLISKLWGLVKAVCFILLYGRVSHDVQHHHENQHESALDDIKQLENDLKGIFAWKNPEIYYTSVEFSLLLQCMYVALWATNFVMLASESRHVVLWEFALLTPMFLNFAMMKHILFISCQLRSIIKIDKAVASKISEEAIEERSVKERLRRMIRDQLKTIAPDKRQWKSVLYSHYSQVMDENEEITQKEWKEFLYSLTLQLTNNSIRQLFKVIDQDQDGFIHWNDLYMIIFPDLIKKKVKIRKKGKRHGRHRSKSSANEHPEDGNQFSMEYHISEEDRLSYKKSTTTRTSILASSMKMIRSSLLPTASFEPRPSTTKASGSPLSGSPPSASPPQAERKEVVAIAEREYKDSRESSTQSKPRSILKSAASDDPLQLDMTSIYPTNAAENGELQHFQNSAAKTSNQPRKTSVSFDEERIEAVPVSRSTSPHPSLSKKASDHSLTAYSSNTKSKVQTDDESLEEMRERSRSIARQRSLSYRPPAPSPARSIGGTMFSALKSTFGNKSKDTDDDEEDDDDVPEDDRNFQNPSQALPYHRFHSVQSRIEENDDAEEDEEEEEIDERSNADANFVEEDSDTSDLSQITNEVSDESEVHEEGESPRRSFNLTAAERQALLSHTEEETAGTSTHHDRSKLTKTGSFYDI